MPAIANVPPRSSAASAGGTSVPTGAKRMAESSGSGGIASAPPALAALDRGGTLAIAGIHLSDVPGLDYQRDLFEERTLQSVTANTRRDGEEFLREAARIGVRVTTSPYPMDRADVALRDLAHDRVAGAAVLVR